MKIFRTAFLYLLSIGLLGLIGAVATVSFVIHHFSQDLPDYNQLKSYEPPIITRIYAGDGRLMAEYAQQRRIFMPIQKIPDVVKNAFLSAEDQNFYSHSGVDPEAIARAAINYIYYKLGRSNTLIGGSTITQQVVKNFLLNKDRKFKRKIKEAILALRIEKVLTKDQILELYLNEIFLGQRAYGVAAASLVYFNKSLDELGIDEAAYLAALPKAPNNYHPTRQHKAALGRRNWVIGRMAEDGHITVSQAELAKAKPLTTQTRKDSDVVDAPFFAEEVRRKLNQKYGGDSLYKGGLTVKTSVDPKLQEAAQRTLREGLMEYDKRHGYRGRVASLKNMGKWEEGLTKIKTPEGMLDEWELAVVLSTNAQKAELGFEDGSKAELLMDGVRWARKCLQDCYALGPEIIRVNDVVSKSDIIMVEKIDEKYVLRQVPKIQGALIALDPHTGRILAMQGGWSSESKFNRATQAQRQPGSAFKPFVYLAALDEGFTPSTRVLDAPFVYEQAPGDFWRPSNYSNKTYGPTPIRKGIEKSRNLMTVRLADHMGMDKVVTYAEKFGIAEKMKPLLSYSLGAGETTLIKMTTAYGMLVNGGKKITPTFIDRIQDRQGKTIFSHDARPCPNCGDLIRWEGQRTPNVADTREQIADEKTTYQIVSIMEGVVERGTARRVGAQFEQPLAGKTGTTNESKDAWFIGFSPDLVVGVFTGFDEPKSMGKRETGSSVAAPIFASFMKDALKDVPPTPFRVPAGVRHVRINADNGRAAMPGDSNIIWEAFVNGTEPNNDNYVLDTQIIGADDYYANPYGYENSDGTSQFGYEDYPTEYRDENVEIYNPFGDQPTNNSPFSYFQNRDSDNNQNQRDQERYIPPKEQPSLGNNEDGGFSGTGGIY
ncbi:MAG: penicillin-binding protein 1A [Alphaproteobacteria bacterium]|nr:penicillin-binding protein 1A [Alphaproteobacteria bacterium]